MRKKSNGLRRPGAQPADSAVVVGAGVIGIESEGEMTGSAEVMKIDDEYRWVLPSATVVAYEAGDCSVS